MQKPLKEVRCPHCNKLLAKVRTAEALEIKCPRCKAINKSHQH